MKKNGFFRVMAAFIAAAAILLAGCDNITNSGGQSGNESAVPGADLAAKLAWLKNYARSDHSYLITIDKNETLAGDNYLYYPTSTGKGNITIRLTGDWAISLLFDDYLLFEIGNGVTLILDKIALYGEVRVESGGVLEMGTGAIITGEYGEVYVSGGTFTMSGGTISNGYGVSVSGGTFTMSGGTISNNTGVGVYVSGGIFTKTGGTITGSDAQNSDGSTAVYAGIRKYREKTAGPGVALDSTKSGAAGGWDDDIIFTPLTVDTWADGNLPQNGVQWFMFTATASTQYIHASFGTLTSLYVQMYLPNNIVYSTSLHDSNKYTSLGVTVGQEYYIRVENSNSGTYKIAFNASQTAPAL
ncbi:MAG: autotransporter adhesin family protein [Treponema sp.]|nr:autotransporter adhesin family protein [Treponema sp.]